MTVFVGEDNAHLLVHHGHGGRQLKVAVPHIGEVQESEVFEVVVIRSCQRDGVVAPEHGLAAGCIPVHLIDIHAGGGISGDYFQNKFFAAARAGDPVDKFAHGTQGDARGGVKGVPGVTAAFIDERQPANCQRRIFKLLLQSGNGGAEGIQRARLVVVRLGRSGQLIQNLHPPQGVGLICRCCRLGQQGHGAGGSLAAILCGGGDRDDL